MMRLFILGGFMSSKTLYSDLIVTLSPLTGKVLLGQVETSDHKRTRPYWATLHPIFSPPPPPPPSPPSGGAGQSYLQKTGTTCINDLGLIFASDEQKPKSFFKSSW
jgi:hypothetical protein